MTGQRAGTASGYRERNSTADRALDILQLFNEEKLVWTAAEISEALGVARSTGYRYVQSLVNSGFLEEGDRAFRLGPKVIELARLARRGIGLSEIARPVMRELADEVQESVLLTRRSGTAVVCLEMEESAHPIRLSYERGHVLPLNAGAAAEVLLAWEPDDAVDQLLSMPLEAFTRATITDPEKLKRRLKKIRSQGYAATRGELDENVLGVAAPIWGVDGRIRAAVSVAAVAGRVPPEHLPVIAEAVIRAADQISEQLARLEG